MTEFVNDNGERLEYSGEEVTFTKQIASFRNFKIKGDFTASFKIANNSHNRQALGYYGLQQIGNHAFAPNPFNLVRNGNFNRSGNIIIEDDDGQEIGCYFISGNANWFKAFDFPSNQITNTKLQVQYNATGLTGIIGKTYGMVLPLIDYAYYRNKFDKYFLVTLIRGTESPAYTGSPDLYPCLYVHTLLQELAKTAEIRVTGDLLNDQLFKTLIMTPYTPDLIDTATGSVIDNSQINSFGGGGPYIQISAIPDPAIKAIDIIKWLCFSFGCVPTFDEFRQTLTLNKIDNIKKESALDWSEYFQSHEIKYSDFYEHNFIHVKKAPEDEIKTGYNESNLIPFGEVDIRTKRLGGSEIDLYTSPFPPAKDGVGSTVLNWATPFIQFLKFTDDKQYTYTSVFNAAGKTEFHGDFSSFSECGHDVTGLVFRVVDDAGIYTGYHIANPFSSISGAGTAWTLQSNADVISNSTGKIYFQKMTKQNPGNRILICIPTIGTNAIISKTPAFGPIGGTAASLTSVSSAYYSKPRHVWPHGDLNLYRQGLSYGEINYYNYNDITLPEAYWNKINAFIRNPPVFGYFMLPESVFAAFNFDQFIFIRHKELSGYFFVESIDNYKDSTTVVRCILNYVDGYSALAGYNLQGIKAGYPELDSTGRALGYDSSLDYDKFDLQVGMDLNVSIISSLVTNIASLSYTATWSALDTVLLNTQTVNGSAPVLGGNVGVIVTKTTNGGIVQGTGATYTFKKNGILISFDSQGAGAAGISGYSFLAVALTDVLEVDIVENT